MPDNTEDKTELVEAARAMATPEPQFGTFMSEAIEAAERFQVDAAKRKKQNKPE